MDSTQLLAAFRDEVADTEAPYLWPDATVYRYMDEAVKMFHRKTEGIEDARSSLTQLSVAPGREWLTLSPLILKIRTVNRSDDGRPVELIPQEKADQRQVRFDGRVGPLRALITGASKDALRLYPLPVETLTLRMSVFRLPLEPITGSGQELELDEQHHYALLMWMKYLAYSKHDAETIDLVKAQDFEAAFLRYCAMAEAEQGRARHPAGNVVYGGI